MSLWAILGTLVTGGGVFGLATLFFKWLTESQQRQGALEERQKENDRQAAAKQRADAVLSEQRDPDAVVDRLQRGDF